MSCTTFSLYCSERSISRKGIWSAAATRIASSRSSFHVHSINSGCQIFMKTPTTSYPWLFKSAAETAESTPPESPTYTVAIWHQCKHQITISKFQTNSNNQNPKQRRNTLRKDVSKKNSDYLK